MDVFLWVLLGIAGVSYLGMPIVIRFAQKMAANPRLEQLDPASLPPNLTNYLCGTAEALQAQGFDEAAYIAMPNQVPNVEAYLALLINRKSGDKAMVTAIFGTNEGTTVLTSTYLEFSTRFENGQVFNTSNSRTLGSFKTGPNNNKAQLPTVQDPALLYRIHQYRMAKTARGGPKVTYGRNEASAYLIRVLIEDYEEQSRFGWLYLDHPSDTYRPTWKGAYLMTWGLLWPINAIRNLSIRQKEQALLKEFASRNQSQAGFIK